MQFINRKNNKIKERDCVMRNDACKKKYTKAWIVESLKYINIVNLLNEQNATGRRDIYIVLPQIYLNSL